MGSELKQEALVVGDLTAAVRRSAAIHVADRVAAEHPHPLDGLMPRLSGRLVAKDPAVAAGVLELLAALGLEAP